MRQSLRYLRTATCPKIPDDGHAEALNLAQASVSRNVSALSAIHRNRRPGMGLVETVVDPWERRRIIHLTRKGKQFVPDIEAMMA